MSQRKAEKRKKPHKNKATRNKVVNFKALAAHSEKKLQDTSFVYRMLPAKYLSLQDKRSEDCSNGTEIKSIILEKQ